MAGSSARHDERPTTAIPKGMRKRYAVRTMAQGFHDRQTAGRADDVALPDHALKRRAPLARGRRPARAVILFRKVSVIVLCALGSAVAAARGGGIHIAFHNGTTTTAAMAPATNPTATGTVVNTAVDTWNNVVNGVNGLVVTNLALLDASGATSGASLSLSSGYSGYDSNGWGSKNKDYVMMEGWYGFRAAEFLTVSNLPPAFTTGGYRVVVYGDANAARTMNYFIGGATNTIVDAGTFAGDFGPYSVTFTGLTNAHFTMTGNPSASDSRSAVNGLQILAGSGAAPPSIRRFEATPCRIEPGGATELRWQVSDAAVVAIAPGIGDVTALTTNGSGRLAVSPSASTTYTLSVTGAPPGAAVAATEDVAVGPPVPNILFFLVDDMGWQDTSLSFLRDTNGAPVVTALNQRYRTPAMETLASRGMMFTAAYAAPVCTPTRVALMTGKSPARHRVTNWTTVDGAEPSGSNSTNLRPPSDWRRTGMASNEAPLPRLLARSGYRTLHAGKAHFGCIGSYAQYPQAIGFDVNIAGSEIGNPASYYGTNDFGSGSHHVRGLDAYHGQDIFLTEALTREMRREIGTAVSNGSPFFAYMAHYAVHSPWQPDGRFTTNYPGLSGNNLAFATLIEGMDRSLGDLLAALDDFGVASNTLVVFLSDNGGDNVNTPLRSKKGTLFEGGVRVPMLAAWARPAPAHPLQAALPIEPASRTSDSVLAWDLYPTLLGVAGADAPVGIEGCDLRGYLRGTAGFHRQQQFAMHYPHNRSNGVNSQTPGSLWRDGPWKLIYDYETASGQLFNLDEDLSETNDLAATHPDRVMTMTRALARSLDSMAALFPERLSDGTPVPTAMPALPQVDLDADGIPDLEEDADADGLRDPAETDPDLPDTDSDGTPDGAERRTGCDPLNPASRFTAALTPAEGRPGDLSWPSGTGVLFRIEKTASLLTPGPWIPVAEEVTGREGRVTFPLPTPGPGEASSFYRVQIK